MYGTNFKVTKGCTSSFNYGNFSLCRCFSVRELVIKYFGVKLSFAYLLFKPFSSQLLVVRTFKIYDFRVLRNDFLLNLSPKINVYAAILDA